MNAKRKTSVQLTKEAKELLALLARHFGISQSAVLELAIREKANRDGIVNKP